MGRLGAKRAQKTLALDPGATVGWALYDNGEFTSGEIAMDVIGEFCSSIAPESLVIELFSGPARRKFFDLAGSEAATIAREWAHERGIEPVFQTPAQAKHYFTDKRLRALDRYQPGQPHANDAMRHLLYYLEWFGTSLS